METIWNWEETVPLKKPPWPTDFFLLFLAELDIFESYESQYEVLELILINV